MQPDQAVVAHENLTESFEIVDSQLHSTGRVSRGLNDSQLDGQCVIGNSSSTFGLFVVLYSGWRVENYYAVVDKIWKRFRGREPSQNKGLGERKCEERGGWLGIRAHAHTMEEGYWVGENVY